MRLYETRGRWAPAEVFVPWLVKVAQEPLSRPVAAQEGTAAGRGRARRRDARSGRQRPESPEAAVIGDSRRRLVWRALRSLGPLSREIILLKDIQGLALEEIATMLRVPLGTVKSRSNRARLELATRVLALDGEARTRPVA